MRIKPKMLHMLRLLSGLLIIISTSAVSEESSAKQPQSTPIIPGTTNIIPIMDGYYKALNQQLSRHVKNQIRDPFSNPLSPRKQSKEIEFKPQRATRPTNQNPTSNLQKKKFSDLPAMSFRGVTESAGKKLALLEIHGLGTFVVEKGDKVGLQQVVSSGAVLHILEINDLNLIVETGSYGQQMVVQ